MLAAQVLLVDKLTQDFEEIENRNTQLVEDKQTLEQSIQFLETKTIPDLVDSNKGLSEKLCSAEHKLEQLQARLAQVKQSEGQRVDEVNRAESFLQQERAKTKGLEETQRSLTAKFEQQLLKVDQLNEQVELYVARTAENEAEMN